MNETKTTFAADEQTTTALRTEIRELSPVGEELSADEIELVAGGLAVKCTRPGRDGDATCVPGGPD